MVMITMVRERSTIVCDSIGKCGNIVSVFDGDDFEGELIEFRRVYVTVVYEVI